MSAVPRAFLAIGLDAGLRAAFEAASAAFLAEAPAWAGEKWVRPELLHLTLRFLGDLTEADVPELVSAVSRCVAGLGDANLQPAALAAAPSAREARMVWGTFAPDRGLDRLASAIRDASRPFGDPPDPRPFRAHVTLVRARRPRRVPASALEAANGRLTALADPMSVASVTLLSSTLGPDGPRYDELARIPLVRA